MQGGAQNTLALRRPVPVTPAMLTPPDRAVTPATSEDGPARCRAGIGYASISQQVALVAPRTIIARL